MLTSNYPAATPAAASSREIIAGQKATRRHVGKYIPGENDKLHFDLIKRDGREMTQPGEKMASAAPPPFSFVRSPMI